MTDQPKFPTHEAYLEWCAGMCQKIKANCIAMNNDGIREAVHEIDDMLYTTDHQDLFGPSRIAELEAIVGKLPKWADGTVAFPGDDAYRVRIGPRGGRTKEQYVVGWDQEDQRWAVGVYWEGRAADGGQVSFEAYQPVSNFYSTPQSAEAAR